MKTQTNKKIEERKVCDVRWYPERGSSRVLSPVFSPFTYIDTIVQRLSILRPSEMIEFIQGDNVVYSCTVKMISNICSHVYSIVSKGDLSILNEIELDKLKYANPWDFIKSKEMQDIINKLGGR